MRVTVNVPQGIYADLEEQLQTTYSLKEAVVVDSVEHDDQILHDIGSAAAYYLETTLRADDLIGVSSWNSPLLAMVDALQPLARSSHIRVLQILGGLGNPSAGVYASRLVGRLATWCETRQYWNDPTTRPVGIGVGEIAFRCSRKEHQRRLDSGVNRRKPPASHALAWHRPASSVVSTMGALHYDILF